MLMCVWWKTPHGLKTRHQKNSLNLNHLVQLTAVRWTLSPAGLSAAFHLQCILGSHVCSRHRLGTAAHGHCMGSTWEPVCISSGQLKRNSGGTLKGHIELQHFQRQLANDSYLKRKRKTRKDMQAMFLCKKGTVLLRSLFNSLHGLGRALIKGSTEELNTEASEEMPISENSQSIASLAGETQLLQEEHVHQCSRRSSPSWAESSRCPNNKDWICPNAMSSTSPLLGFHIQFGDVHHCSCTQRIFLSP